jgi:hypothetical protein
MMVSDKKSCEKWIAQAPLGDPVTACGAVAQLLESLEDHPPKKAQAHLEVLECLRRPIVLTAEALAYRLGGRALPLTEAESQSFMSGCDMYSAYGRAFRRLIQLSHSEADSTLVEQLPLMLGRAAECSCELMIMHYRVRREIDGEHWHDLHELYRLAESLGVASTPPPPASERTPSCADAYVRALLLSLTTPYGMTPRAFDWARRWVRRWSGKVELTRESGPRDSIAVNLASSFAPRARAAANEGEELLRFLDLSTLRRSVKSRIRALEEGEDPHALGLGSEGSPEELLEILRLLYQQWFEMPIARQYKRRLISSRAELLGGFAIAHAAMCDAAPVQKRHEWEFSRAEWERIAVTGSQPVYQPPPVSVTPERWDLLEESAMGFRLRRRDTGLRFFHRQLIALRPQGDNRFILAEIRWLITGIDSTVTMGVRNLPGLAMAVTVRPASSPEGARFREAFALPGSGNEPATLVLAGGMFKPDLVIEMKANDVVRKVVVKELVYRGFDFDRVEFAVVGN